MRKELTEYTPLVKFLNDALGENFSVSLIDTEDVSRSGTEAAGSSGRDAGKNADKYDLREDGSLSLLLNDILHSSSLKGNDYICSFCEEAAGAQKKNSVFNIHADDGSLAGFLCIEEEKGDLYMVKEVFDELMTPEGQEGTGSQRIANEVDSLMEEKILTVWRQYCPSRGKPKKADKLAFISELFEMGIFRIRGGARKVSEITGISQASVYRYLGEIIEE